MQLGVLLSSVNSSCNQGWKVVGMKIYMRCCGEWIIYQRSYWIFFLFDRQSRNALKITFQQTCFYLVIYCWKRDFSSSQSQRKQTCIKLNAIKEKQMKEMIVTGRLRVSANCLKKREIVDLIIHFYSKCFSCL